MAKKNIQELLRGANLDTYAEVTGINADRLRSIALEGASMVPAEAVALAQLLEADAKVLLDLQTEEQLKKLEYVSPKASKASKATKTGAAPRSQTSSSRAVGNSVAGDLF